jgi:heme/copper-type cytochrome/quinol oxidase subunit 3
VKIPENNDALDVSGLPSFGFSHRSPMWWGTMGLIAIESTVFVLCIMSYFYLYSRSTSWPMSTPPPDLFWGTLNTMILLVSVLPNQFAKRYAQKLDLPRVRCWLGICMIFSVAFLLVRIFELRALNVRWDTDAYGSIVWMTMGLHTFHLLTDTVDSLVLTVLMFTGPLEGKRFVDVSENSMYWNFVVGSWLIIYAVIYWGPRF